MTERVLIYGMNYAPEIAGVGRYTGEIAEHLATLGCDVEVITTHPHYPGWILASGSSTKWIREEVGGVVIFRCPLYLNRDMKGFRRFLAPLSFALSSAPIALWRIIAHRPNVVVAIEPTLLVAPFALTGALIVGAKTVLHVQDLEIDAAFAVGHLRSEGIVAIIARAFDRSVIRRFDRIITIANSMATRIIAKGVQVDRIEVVRNWVNLDQICPVANSSAYRNELNLACDDFIVLYSGNIGAKQGVHLIIESARRLVGHQKLRFVIAGDGPMRRMVDEEARLLPNLCVLDFQPTSRFSEFLGVADLHILPQERGTADLLLPSKLGGMLASGKPILVAADPGTELANFLGQSCTLTPAGDVIAFTKALQDLVREPDSPAKREDRLKLAQTLSMEANISDFARLCLFRGPSRL